MMIAKMGNRAMHTSVSACVVYHVCYLIFSIFFSFMEKDKLREVASPDFRPSDQVSCAVQALYSY